jgi:PAS domain S-box-containing protein
MHKELNKKKILVVDNHPLILMWMSELLKTEGHSVLTADDGLSALAILRNWVPDIIFADLIMPNIDGKTLCQIIRQMPELKDVFIVILSAAGIEELEKLSQTGADICIPKGKLSKMAPHILNAIEESNKKPSERLKKGEIIVYNGIHPRQITKELLSLKSHLESILKNLSESVLELTHDFNIVFVNSAASSLIEKPEEELLGTNFIELFSENDRPRLKGFLSTSDKSPRRIGEDFPLMLNNKYVLLNVTPIMNSECSSIIVTVEEVDIKEIHKV